MFKAHLQSPDFINKVAALFTGKSEAEIISTIIKIGAEKGANKQYAAITCVEEYISRKGVSRPIPTLADGIMIDFAQKIESFGERAYPLSDKQVAVIGRKISNDLIHINNLEMEK